MAMLVKFNAQIARHADGGCFAVGREYLLGREEACLWIKRGTVDLKSLRAADATPEAIAASDANLKPPGKRLSFGEVIAALSKVTAPG